MNLFPSLAISQDDMTNDREEPANKCMDPCETHCAEERENDDDSFRTALSSQHGVTFSDTLVSDVRERPRTLPEERATLFYQADEIRGFRQEYRLAIRQKLAARRKANSMASISPLNISSLQGLVVKANQFFSSVSKHGIGLTKALSEPPENDNVFVDTLYLF